MRVLFLAFFLAPAICCLADERPKAVSHSGDKDSVEQLVEKVSESCSGNDFISFMSCFTPKAASSIRSRAETAFIRGGISMDVVDFFLISADDESVSFGLRYFLKDSKSEKIMYCSKVVAKKCEHSLLIDSEQVKEKRPPSDSYSSSSPPLAGPKPLCADGRCDVNAGWRQPNPANGGEEAWLPQDILFKPGPSCANGNCGFKR